MFAALQKLATGKMSIRVKGRKLFVNMLLANILIGLIPVFILGLINYQMNAKIMMKDVTISYKKSLDRTVNDSDRYIQEIYGVMRSLGDNSSISEHHWTMKNQYSWEFLNFFYSFEKYIQYYNGVNSIFILIDDMVISTEKGMLTATDFSDGDWSRKAISRAKENYKYLVPYVSEKRRRTGNGNENGYDVISVISPIGNRSFDQGTIVLNIFESYFRENLNQLKKYKQDSIYVINAVTGNIISKSDGTNYYSSLPSSQIMGYIKQLDTSQNWGTIDVNGRKTVVAVSKSTHTEWVYISFSDYKNITGQLDVIRNATIFYLILLILVELLISIFLAAKVYSPMKNLITNVINLKNRSAKDEITSINDFVSSIITTNDQNQKIITQSLPSLRENILLNLLIGNRVDERGVQEKVNYCGIDFKHNGYFVVLVLFDQFSNFIINHPLKQRMDLKHYLLQLIETELNHRFTAYGVETDEDKLCFIMNVNEDFKFENIKESFVVIKETAYEKISNTFTVAVGNLYLSLSEIRLSYLEALEASKERFTQGENAVIYFRELELRSRAFYSHIKQEEELLDSIFDCNEEKIVEIIGDILEDANKKGLQSEKIKQIVLEIISFVGRRLFKAELTYEEILQSKSSLQEDLGRCETVKDMQNYITHILIIVSKNVGKQNSPKNNDVVGIVKDYIHKNYEKEITQKQMADLVMLTPSYLSTIFYNRTQYNFLEYVNLVRVNKAKELLMDARYSIKDVAEKVGFTNYSSFSRVFKKHAGVTAKQYRYDNGINSNEDNFT